MDTFNALPYIDTNPNRNEKAGWIAHLINDCAIIEHNSEACILEYYKKVSQSQNCVIIPFGPAPLCAAVTIEDVYEGDELFVSYGYSYWMDALGLPDEEKWTEKTDEILSKEGLVFDEIMTAMAYIESKYDEEAEECTNIFNADS